MPSLNLKYAQTKEAFDYLVLNKYTVPNIMIQAFHNLTKHGKLLQIYYYYNPEIAGFDTLSEANWKSSSWHTLKINSDQKKVKYIEQIKEESAAFHEILKASL